jgi:hypothetical protein
VQFELDRAAGVHIGRVEARCPRRKETFPQFRVRQVEFAVVLALARLEEGVVRVIAVEDRRLS